jgi:hypothetical protein
VGKERLTTPWPPPKIGGEIETEKQVAPPNRRGHFACLPSACALALKSVLSQFWGRMPLRSLLKDPCSKPPQDQASHLQGVLGTDYELSASQSQRAQAVAGARLMSRSQNHGSGYPPA